MTHYYNIDWCISQPSLEMLMLINTESHNWPRKGALKNWKITILNGMCICVCTYMHTCVSSNICCQSLHCFLSSENPYDRRKRYPKNCSLNSTHLLLHIKHCVICIRLDRKRHMHSPKNVKYLKRKEKQISFLFNKICLHDIIFVMFLFMGRFLNHN